MKEESPKEQLFTRLLRGYRQRLLNRRFGRIMADSASFSCLLSAFSVVICALSGSSYAYAGLVGIFSFLGAASAFFIVRHQPTSYDAALHAEGVTGGAGELAICAEDEKKIVEPYLSLAVSTLQKALQKKSLSLLSRGQQRVLGLGVVLLGLSLLVPFSQTTMEQHFSEENRPQQASLDAESIENSIEALRKKILEPTGAPEEAPSNLKEQALNLGRESEQAGAKLADARSLKEAIAKKDEESAAESAQRLRAQGVRDIPEGVSPLSEEMRAAAERAIAESEAELLRIDQESAAIKLIENRENDAELAKASGSKLGGDGKKIGETAPMIARPLRISSSAWAGLAKKRGSPQKHSALVSSRYLEYLSRED